MKRSPELYCPLGDETYTEDVLHNAVQYMGRRIIMGGDRFSYTGQSIQPTGFLDVGFYGIADVGWERP